MFAASGFRDGGRLLARVAALLAVLLATGCANTLHVTQQEIQQQIDSRLPAGTAPGMPVTLSLRSLQCDLLAPHESVNSNNVALQAQVHFSVLGLIQMDSTAALQGRLVYSADRGAFYIEQPQLTALDLAGVAPRQQQQLKANLQQLLSSVLAVTPVYTLQDARAKNHIDRIEVQDSVMLVHLKP